MPVDTRRGGPSGPPLRRRAQPQLFKSATPPADTSGWLLARSPATRHADIGAQVARIDRANPVHGPLWSPINRDTGFMILPRVILLHLALVVAPLSTYAFAAVDVPDPGRNVPRLPERSRFQATVTAYSSSPDETWGDPFITASGRRVFDGLVACPRALPFGTQVSIGDRTYQCYDRLHRKYDHRFDIWMATKAAALTFGQQRLPVEVIEVGVAAPHQRLHTVLQDWLLGLDACHAQRGAGTSTTSRRICGSCGRSSTRRGMRRRRRGLPRSVRTCGRYLRLGSRSTRRSNAWCGSGARFASAAGSTRCRRG